MVRYALLFPVDLSQKYLWTKFEDFIPCGFLETELNATGVYFCLINWEICQSPICITAFGRSFPEVFIQKV